MDQCNAVAIGPHWQNSEGSRREVSVALLAGWPIYKVVLKFPLFPSLGYKLELI